MKPFRVIFLALLIALSGCIRNDLDYPAVFGGFTAFEVEGAKSVKIDNASRTVLIDLEEGTDKDHVKLLSYTLTDGATLDAPLGEYLDLTKEIELTLKTYQLYKWKIVGTQHIVRFIRCEKQVGEATFHENARTAVLTVTDDQPLTSVVITGMKLGPEGSVIRSTTGYETSFSGASVVSREITSFPVTLDCVMERTFDVEFKGKLTSWKVKTVQISVDAEVREVIPWCHKADIRAVCSGKYPASLEYKKADDTAWQEVPSAKLAGVGISATLSGLEEGTDYLLRVVENGKASAEFPFRTDREIQLDNMGFDTWNLDGKVWNPFASGAQRVWDSANKATANFLGSITTPDENFVAVPGPGKKAARLESTYAVVKFASGNLFTGQFVSLKGLGAELAWGIPFDSKPKALHGYYCYHPEAVSDADAAYADLKGKMDSGQIRFFLTDWEDQFHVLSAEKVFVDFENDPAIIAYGEILTSEWNDGFVEFTLPLEYRSYRTPKYIVIVCASSYLGDYFTGGRGSTLWVDDFSLVYE